MRKKRLAVPGGLGAVYLARLAEKQVKNLFCTDEDSKKEFQSKLIILRNFGRLSRNKLK